MIARNRQPGHLVEPRSLCNRGCMVEVGRRRPDPTPAVGGRDALGLAALVVGLLLLMAPLALQGFAVLTAASVQLSLAATAWADLAFRAPEEVNGSKRVWALVIAVNFIGPVCYLRWGRRRSPTARATCG